MNPADSNAEHWQQWLDWATIQGLAPPEDAEFAPARARVWAGSEFVALSCARDPALFAEMLTAGDLQRPGPLPDWPARLQAALNKVGDETGLLRVLRRFRRWAMIRIIWRDLAGWATLDETLAELSALADCCVAQTLERLRQWQETELGVPTDAAGQPQRLLVLAMGKLGANELNLSSDIDLIFAFPGHGQVIGGPRPLTNEQFFIRLCQRLIKALDSQTEDGFVFRVDARLRPFGDSGPLAMSINAMEAYYQSQAREWERYAMIKARVIAGDPAVAAELMAMLRPFVYRRYLDYNAIAALRHLKELIDQELRRKGLADNIKLGPGGIREIEFIGQAFQLIRGGREPALRQRSILAVLAELGARELLPAAAVAELEAAYRFLRRTENHLQAWQDRQTHVLPTDAAGQARLAATLDFASWADVLAVLDGHRAAVQRHFDAVFAAPNDIETNPDNPSDLGGLWAGDQDAETAVAMLGAVGFAAPQAAWQRLEQFRQTVERKGLSSRGRDRLASLMPRLLRDIAASASADCPPDATLERVLRVLEAILRRTAYLALLAERPDALDRLVRLCALSPWFAERTARQPLLLDELLDGRRLYAPLHRPDLITELDALLAGLDAEDLEQRMERLRQFAHGNRLRVAAADLTGAIPLMVVSDYLTEIAEVTLARGLEIAWHDLSQRHGMPVGTDALQSGFLIVGYGKLGGIELGYRSDLDLVFLHADVAANAMTDGARPLADAQFYQRLGQRLIHIMTTATYSGVLYEIDMRLRPDGNKGLLVRSRSAFAAYQAEDAWTWEHQALVRARPLAGDPRLGEAFQQIRREILCRARDSHRLRAEVREMREKMRANLDRSSAVGFDLKQGRGGIADIEFMVQYAVLRWAGQHPELVVWSDNIRLLETLERLDLLPGSAARELADAYRALRALEHRNALRDIPGLVPEQHVREECARVQAWWERLFAEPPRGDE